MIRMWKMIGILIPNTLGRVPDRWQMHAMHAVDVCGLSMLRGDMMEGLVD
jgi:hypothetical protein